MDSQPIAVHKHAGFSLAVYANRIETEQMGLAGLKKKQTVLLRNVASVRLPRSQAHILLKTNDGRAYKWVCGRDAEAIYQAIMGSM